MFLWRKSAKPGWVEAHEDLIQADAYRQLVIIRRPGRKRPLLEIACSSRSDARALQTKFGGRVESLPRNWLERFARGDSNPIKIGKRLTIVRSISELRCDSVRCPRQNSHQRAGPDMLRAARSATYTIDPAVLVIPASLAFGTGEHATTAMSLRFLEQLTRHWKRGWSLVDLGTGSGILALAAKRFGASRIMGIDNDPPAISVAESNARLNNIRGITFQLGDVQEWNSAQVTDVITANLYSDVLIKILPKLCGSRWLILSGILHSQQRELLRAMHRTRAKILSMKRRGKWMALLAAGTGTLWAPDLESANFAAVIDRRYSKTDAI